MYYIYNAEAQNGLGFFKYRVRRSTAGGRAGGEFRKTNILSELCYSVREAIIFYTGVQQGSSAAAVAVLEVLARVRGGGSCLAKKRFVHT